MKIIIRCILVGIGIAIGIGLVVKWIVKNVFWK